MPQLSYPRTQPIGFPGMKSSAVTDIVDTGVSEETSADILFGLFVVQGATQDGVKLPAASTDEVMGISTHSHAAQLSFSGPSSGVIPKAPVDVTRKGRVMVSPEDAVTPASKVYMRHTANGGLTQKGAVRGSANTGAVQVLGCRFMGSCAAAGLVELEVDLSINRAIADSTTP